MEISRQRVSDIAAADGWRTKRGRGAASGVAPVPPTAEEIRTFRASATQAECAEAVGVTEDTWRRWERGTQPAPPMLRLALAVATAKAPAAIDGATIRAWRQRHGDLTQRALSLMVGVRKDTIASWERGASVPPAMLRLALRALERKAAAA